MCLEWPFGIQSGLLQYISNISGCWSYQKKKTHRKLSEERWARIGHHLQFSVLLPLMMHSGPGSHVPKSVLFKDNSQAVGPACQKLYFSLCLSSALKQNNRDMVTLLTHCWQNYSKPQTCLFNHYGGEGIDSFRRPHIVKAHRFSPSTLSRGNIFKEPAVYLKIDRSLLSARIGFNQNASASSGCLNLTRLFEGLEHYGVFQVCAAVLKNYVIQMCTN